MGIEEAQRQLLHPLKQLLTELLDRLGRYVYQHDLLEPAERAGDHVCDGQQRAASPQGVDIALNQRVDEVAGDLRRGQTGDAGAQQRSQRDDQLPLDILQIAQQAQDGSLAVLELGLFHEPAAGTVAACRRKASLLAVCPNGGCFKRRPVKRRLSGRSLIKRRLFLHITPTPFPAAKRRFRGKPRSVPSVPRECPRPRCGRCP